MKILRIHITYLLLILLMPTMAWSQREISIDEMPEAFFGNWRDRNGGSVWRIETKREYLGANNFIWRYRRITEENGVYTIDAEYSPPSLPPYDPVTGRSRQRDSNRGSVQRFIFSNIMDGSMTINDRYRGYKFQAVIKKPTYNFKVIQPKELPEDYMGTWATGEGAYPEEMIVSRSGVRVNGIEWKYFEIMKDEGWNRVVLQHKNDFHIWVPHLEGKEKLSSVYYPYTRLRRKAEKEYNASANVISIDQVPKEIFGNWQDGSGIWQYQIKRKYFGVDNKVWMYRRITARNETYSFEVRDAFGTDKQYAFRVLPNGRILAIDAYRGNEYSMKPKPFGNRFYPLKPSEIPAGYLGKWVAPFGEGEKITVNRDHVTIDGNIWQYDEILVYGGEHRFMLKRNGRYQLWIPRLIGKSRMTGIFDSNTHLRLDTREVPSVPRIENPPSGSDNTDPAIDDQLNVENSFINGIDSFRGEVRSGGIFQEEEDSLMADTFGISGFSPPTQLISLPDAMYKNWNSRNGEWVFDIQKSHLSLEQNAWGYQGIRQEGETYFLDLGFRSIEGNKNASQQISLRLISDFWMEVVQAGIRYEVLAMPFNDSFYLIHADDLPASLLGDWYHTSGSDSLALQIRRDSLQWRGDMMAYEQIIRKKDAYFATLRQGNMYRIFQIEQMEDGFLQVVLEDQTNLFNRQPILPSMGRMLLIVLAVLLLGGGLVWLFFRWRTKNLQRKEIAKRREIELELKALRSQMNPHFLFNSLNSIQNLINKQEPDQANHYLSRFSSLMRKVLNNTESAFITLEEEIAILNLYCELEALRFQFEYQIDIDPEIDVYNTEIPGMLIQPFVENAIRHGIGPSDAAGKLNIGFQIEGELLCCSVEDNGIGIQASLAQKKQPTGNNGSFGIRLAEERLEMIHTHYGEEVRIEILDKGEGDSTETGTRIQMYLPTNLS